MSSGSSYARVAAARLANVQRVISVAVLGAGYVGLTTAAGLCCLGHKVSCADIDSDRLILLRRGFSPIVEVGLEDLIREGVASERLSFHSDNVEAVRDAAVVFLCVPTPQGIDGRADMSYVDSVSREIGPFLAPGSIVVNKSTVPVGSASVVQAAIGRNDVAVASNPEFLREGSAVRDFLHPDRIVIGADEEDIAARVAQLFLRTRAPVILTDPATAETIKYASNAFLATKLSFVNAVAALCEALGADAPTVMAGMGLDARIGGSYMEPGPGWGGSCLPKDTAALVRIADDAGYDFALLKGTIAANEEQRERMVRKLCHLSGGSLEGAVIAQWGLTFKSGTDDLRGSPAIDIANRLANVGARVRAYDPAVAQNLPGIETVSDPLAACKAADALFVATEWEAFRHQDFEEVGRVMARRAVLDSRNILNAEAVRRAGFDYQGVGSL